MTQPEPMWAAARAEREATNVAARCRITGGTDEPELTPPRQNDQMFPLWTKDAGHCCFVPLEAVLASRAVVAYLNEQHVSKPAMRN